MWWKKKKEDELYDPPTAEEIADVSIGDTLILWYADPGAMRLVVVEGLYSRGEDEDTPIARCRLFGKRNSETDEYVTFWLSQIGWAKVFSINPIKPQYPF